MVLVVFVLLLLSLSVGFGHLVAVSVALPQLAVSPSTHHPLTVLISTADAGVGEVDYWVHSILSHLGRSIDVQVVQSGNLVLKDDSIIIAFNDLHHWKDLVQKSSFRNVGLLRIGTIMSCQLSWIPHQSTIHNMP